MPWSALPPHINEPAEWAGTDWDNPWQRWLLRLKGFFAYGYRAKEWWARWRRVPQVLVAFGGDGEWRYEWENGQAYLSRVQYWRAWHIALHWPLCLVWHIYWGGKSPIQYPLRPAAGSLGLKILLFGYIGAHYDSDAVFWFPSGYIGGVWK